MFKCPLCLSEKIEEKPLGDCLDHYFLCRVCQFLFLNPAMRLDEQAERSRYLLHQNDVEDLRYQNFMKPLMSEIVSRVKPHARGLDFGAGTGPVLAKMLQKEGYQISLYDPYFWPDRSVLTQEYDFIFASEVVEHLYEPRREFDLLRSRLRTEGLLALTTEFYTSTTDFESWYYRKDPTHVGFYCANTFAWIQEHFGFSRMQVLDERIALLTV